MQKQVSSEWRYNISYILSWYLLSILLSIYNKTLLGKTNFNFPILMSAIHSGTHFIITRIILNQHYSINKKEYIKKIVPCSLASAIEIACANASLSLITLSFYTMIKSSTPIWTLLFSFLFGFEKPRLRLVAIITCIIFGVLLTIDGEPHINLQGFTLVLVAAISSGLRWNLTQFLLKDSNISNHGPLVIMYHLSPVMFITMLSLSLYIEQPFFYHHDFTTDSIHTIKEIVISISIMSVGGILAFLMTLSELYLIKGTNTVTLSVAGVGKEIFIIGLSVIIYGDVLTLKTYLGLFISIMGIIGYNYYKHQSKDSHKACPDKQKRYLE